MHCQTRSGRSGQVRSDKFRSGQARLCLSISSPATPWIKLVMAGTPSETSGLVNVRLKSIFLNDEVLIVKALVLILYKELLILSKIHYHISDEIKIGGQ